MTIEEIKKKYESEAKVQKQAIEAAERKRDLQRAWVEQLIAERQELIPKRGIADHDTREKINYLTFKINEANGKLAKLESECEKVRIGDNLDKAINSMKL